MLPKIYVASPLGFTPYGARFQADLVTALEADGFTVLDPWAPFEDNPIASAAALPLGDERIRALERANTMIAAANEALIVESDGMLAVLDGSDVDSGTAAEIGFAAAFNKKVVGLRLDGRNSGDNDATIVNLQVEYFIAHTGGSIHRSVAAAVNALRDLFPRGAERM